MATHKQTGAQSGDVISTFVLTGGGAKFIKRAAFISKINYKVLDRISLNLAKMFRSIMAQMRY